MGYIPMKQYAKIHKSVSGGVSDGWGGSIPSEPIILRCRFQEENRALEIISQEQERRQVRGREESPGGKFFFDRLADITLDDRIEYTNENNVTKMYKPLSVQVVRGVGGRPIHTVVRI